MTFLWNKEVLAWVNMIWHFFERNDLLLCGNEFRALITRYSMVYNKYFEKLDISRRVWRYQWGNHNLCIEEQTTQWSKEKDKQRSTKHTHKTKDWVTQTPLKTGGERRCSGRVGSSKLIIRSPYITGQIYNGQMKTNNGSQNTQDWATWTPQSVGRTHMLH